MSSVTFSDSLGQTKSVLAKLLASENINVVRQKMPTAAFDLKTRTLYCPIWEAIDGDMYDLLMGHEVGHALFTPSEGWHDALEDNKAKVHKSILNVVEDARIEKKMKRKYPGLARPMLRAYSELNNRDFFGIKNLASLDKLNLVDRINVHYKLGAFNAVPFSETEMEIIRQIDVAEEWDDVVAIANKIQGMMGDDDSQINTLKDLMDQIKEDKEQADQQFSDAFDESESDDSESEEQSESAPDYDSESGEFDDDDDSEGESDDSDFDYEDDDAESSDNPFDMTDKMLQSIEQNIEENEQTSITDQIFRNREKELVVDDLSVVNVYLPEPILKNIIEPIGTQLLRFKSFYDQFNPSQVAQLQSMYNRRFIKNNDKFVQQLVKQFLMKRNASQYSRSLEARTGELDMTKLHKYRFTNDIFAKVKVIPKGQSHGLVLFLDLSGSMNNVLGSTMEQLLIMATFCKRVNIPFDFYGFCDSSQNSRDRSAKRFETSGLNFERNDPMHLKHLLSSEFTTKTYKEAFNMLLCVTYHPQVNYGRLDLPGQTLYDIVRPSRFNFELNGTPLNSAILASREIIEIFKAKHRLDVVNAMFLTDGDATDDPTIRQDDKYMGNITHVVESIKTKNILTIIDRKSKMSMTMKAGSGADATSAFLMFVSKITGCNMIGFYLAEAGTIRSRLKHMLSSDTTIDSKKVTSDFKKNRFFSSQESGFNAYFNVVTKRENIKSDTYDVTANEVLDKKAVKKLTTEFSKNQNDKKVDRIFATKLMEFIC